MFRSVLFTLYSVVLFEYFEVWIVLYKYGLGLGIYGDSEVGGGGARLAGGGCLYSELR